MIPGSILALAAYGVTVTDAPGLLAALKDPRSTTVWLAPGNYGVVAFSGVNPPGLVKIRSLDPKHPAAVAGFRVDHASRLIFMGIELAASAAPDELSTNRPAFLFSDVDSVRLVNVFAHGALDGDPANDPVGVQFVRAKNIQVSASRFSELRIGLSVSNSDGAMITDNDFDGIRIDGINAPGTSNILIERNFFTNNRHIGMSCPTCPGDHADSIQDFTTPNVKPVTNLTIQYNLVVQGIGNVMQGPWIQNEGGLIDPYVNVTIRYNQIVGGNWNAIGVGMARNLVVDGNTIYPLAGAVSVDPVTGAVTPLVPFIKIKIPYVGTNGTAPAVTDGGNAVTAAWKAKYRVVVKPGLP